MSIEIIHIEPTPWVESSPPERKLFRSWVENTRGLYRAAMGGAQLVMGALRLDGSTLEMQ